MKNQKGLLAAAALLVLAFGSWQITEAVQPGSTKPLKLYDASQVFLGDFIGITAALDTPVTYASHLSAPDSILLFIATPSGVRLPNGGTDFPLYYGQPDCQGTAFVTFATTDGNPIIDPNFIVSIVGTTSTFRLNEATTSLLVSSVLNGELCSPDSEDPSFSYRSLVPTPLPFSVQSLEVPLSVRAQ